VLQKPLTQSLPLVHVEPWFRPQSPVAALLHAPVAQSALLWQGDPAGDRQTPPLPVVSQLWLSHCASPEQPLHRPVSQRRLAHSSFDAHVAPLASLHWPAVHAPLLQSASAAQAEPAHLAAQTPPQSTPSSPAFFMPSEQLMHAWLEASHRGDSFAGSAQSASATQATQLPAPSQTLPPFSVHGAPACAGVALMHVCWAVS
jgi:hypothetical protein